MGIEKKTLQDKADRKLSVANAEIQRLKQHVAEAENGLAEERALRGGSQKAYKELADQHEQLLRNPSLVDDSRLMADLEAHFVPLARNLAQGRRATQAAREQLDQEL